MKSFVITIMEEPKSCAVAHRCIESMPDFGVSVWNAITPKDNPEQIAKDKGINTLYFREKYSRYLNCLSAFLSHHSLWEECVRLNEEVQIFEHDAVCVGNLPEFINYQGCISLGKPSYGRFNIPPMLGVNKLMSKQYFPGAHAYRLKPAAAKTLIANAKEHARPTDVYLHNDMFPWLEEYYPWPVEARDTFTTIQNKVGCIAKHNNSESYEII